MCAMSEDNPKSLWLKVEVETTDTAEIKYPSSLIDSRATGEFIDQQYVKSCRLQTRKLSRLIPVHNIDGTLNEAGSITELVDLILWYKGHLEKTLFAVTSLEKEKPPGHLVNSLTDSSALSRLSPEQVMGHIISISHHP